MSETVFKAGTKVIINDGIPGYYVPNRISDDLTGPAVFHSTGFATWVITGDRITKTDAKIPKGNYKAFCAYMKAQRSK